MIPAQLMINRGQAVRRLVLHFAGCLFTLPIKSVQVLWLAAGIGKSQPGSLISVAQTLHMSAAGERVAEVRAIRQLRAAGRGGCHAAVAPAPAAVATGTAVSLPAALITTAAQTVGSRPSTRSLQAAGRSHRGATSHRGASSHREAGRGAALQTAAIDTNTHDSLLIVWALLLLAALGVCAVVAAGRRRGTRWAGEVAAALVSGRGALTSIGGHRRSRRTLTGSPAQSKLKALPAPRTLEASASAEEIAAPAGGWAPPLFDHSQAAPIKEITAPAGGWAPPLLDHSQAAPIKEIRAPEGGWAPALFDHSQAAPIKEIRAPEGGWAPPIHGLTAPVRNPSPSAATSSARDRTVARLRELRAHPPSALGVAGGAIAAILAVATKPQRAGRRHR